ncbi:MAG: CPBP family intramembrane metalloprotease [Lachnospiraceae bacterium]|nr:CPBP family intramembrane metalloprotease [Lachnospiraceae bacterium]
MDGNDQRFYQQVPPQGQPQMPPPGGYYQPGFDPFMMQNFPQGYNYGQPRFGFDQKGAKRHFSGIGMSYFVFSIAAAAVQVIVSIAVNLIDRSLWDNYLFMLLASILPMYLVGAPICIMMMKKLTAEKPEKAPCGFGHFLVGLIIALGLMYTGNFIGTYIGLMIEAFAPQAQASTNDVQELVFSGDLIINIVIMVVIGPIVEELLFRKLLCDRLRPYGEGVTVVVTGLLFGLFHGNLTQGVYAFLLGCFMAYVYLRTGRVTITIVYHIVLNFIGSIVPLLALNATDLDGIREVISTGDDELLAEYVEKNIDSFMIYGLYAMSVIGVMVIGMILLIVLLATGKINFRPGRFTIPKGRRFGTVIINVGMILFILSGIAEILLNMFA